MVRYDLEINVRISNILLQHLINSLFIFQHNMHFKFSGSWENPMGKMSNNMLCFELFSYMSCITLKSI